MGVFVGLRHNLDSFDDFDLADTTALAGAQARVAVTERIELRRPRDACATRLDDGTTELRGGGRRSASSRPTTCCVSVGYNVVGFRDPDFTAARSTERGFYARSS